MPAVDRVAHLERRPATRLELGVRKRLALLETIRERLARAPARGHDSALRVENDDHLAALLDEVQRPGCLEPELGVLVGRAYSPASGQAVSQH